MLIFSLYVNNAFLVGDDVVGGAFSFHPSGCGFGARQRETVHRLSERPTQGYQYRPTAQIRRGKSNYISQILQPVSKEMKYGGRFPPSCNEREVMRVHLRVMVA